MNMERVIGGWWRIFQHRYDGGARSRAVSFRVCGLVLLFSLIVTASLSQTAILSDAWWTYSQDCDGDTNIAGTLIGGFARLNWFPDVNNCNGSINVYEKVSFRSCGTSAWTPIYTNGVHKITGCSSSNQRYVDIQMGSGGACRDYKVEVFRSGQSNPDSIRSSTNDVHLSQRKEELLAQDVCANDAFATPMVISGPAGTQADNNANATKEASEPNHAGNAGGHSLWYAWTAPTNKPVTFHTIGSGIDTVLAVYTGSSLGALTLVTNKDDIAGATNRMSQVTFTPTTGTTYRIAVDGFGGAAGNIELNWNQSGGAMPDLIVWGATASLSVLTKTFPANDCEVLEGCAVSGTRKLLTFNMETRNIGNADLVLGNPGTNSVFRWATCHGHYHFEAFAQYTLLDTNLNPVMLGTNIVAGHKVGFCVVDVSRWDPTASASKKYTDCSTSTGFFGIQKGWADVYESTLPCQYVDITGLPAGDYVLQMTVNPDGLLQEADYANNSALIPFSLPPSSCVTAPANDTFTNAITVDASPFTDGEFINCATKQSGEPNHAGNAGGHSIWYKWTPTSNHTAVITTKGSRMDTLLAVYLGTAVNSLSLVASNDDIVAGSVVESSVSFSAVAGNTYRIAVDGFNGAVGTVRLNVNPPGNDDFAARYTIAGRYGSTNGYTLGASKQTNETAHASDVGGHSVWFKWTAPASGFVDFNTKGSAYDTTLAVYLQGSLSSTNLPLAANDDDAESGGLQSSRLFFYAQTGTNYNIAVDGFGGDVGDLKLNWNMNCAMAITNLPGGNICISLTGVDWQRYVLLSSSNLVNWVTNTSAITMMDAMHLYTNSLGTSNNPFSGQFYRAVQVP